MSVVGTSQFEGKSALVTGSGESDWATTCTPASKGIDAVETVVLVRNRKNRAPNTSLKEFKGRAMAHHPSGQYGTPGDFANASRSLLSDDASFINGTELPVDGGIRTKLALSRTWEN